VSALEHPETERRKAEHEAWKEKANTILQNPYLDPMSKMTWEAMFGVLSQLSRIAELCATLAEQAASIEARVQMMESVVGNLGSDEP